MKKEEESEELEESKDEEEKAEEENTFEEIRFVENRISGFDFGEVVLKEGGLEQIIPNEDITQQSQSTQEPKEEETPQQDFYESIERKLYEEQEFINRRREQIKRINQNPDNIVIPVFVPDNQNQGPRPVRINPMQELEKNDEEYIVDVRNPKQETGNIPWHQDEKKYKPF